MATSVDGIEYNAEWLEEIALLGAERLKQLGALWYRATVRERSPRLLGLEPGEEVYASEGLDGRSWRVFQEGAKVSWRLARAEAGQLLERIPGWRGQPQRAPNQDQVTWDWLQTSPI